MRTIDSPIWHYYQNKAEKSIRTEQGILEGAFEMLPIQQHFLEDAYPEMTHYNQSLLLSVEKGITKEFLNLQGVI